MSIFFLGRKKKEEKSGGEIYGDFIPFNQWKKVRAFLSKTSVFLGWKKKVEGKLGMILSLLIK